MVKDKFKTYMYLLLVVIIISLILILMFIRFRNTVKIEGFMDSKQQYQKYGVAKCTALEASVEDIGARSYTTMNDFINGNRLQEWKPVESTMNPTRTKTNSKYCYILNDSANDVQDYIMQGNLCDMNNPMFKGNPMFNNVFTDISMDATHTRPIQKCILDINESKIDPKNLTQFYSTIGNIDCEQLTTKMNSEMRSAQKEQLAASSEFLTYQNIYSARSNLAFKTRGESQQCDIDLSSFKNAYISKNRSNVDLMTFDTSAMNQLGECQTNLSELRFENRKAINTLTAERDSNLVLFKAEELLTKNCASYISKANIAQSVANTNTSTLMENLMYCASNNVVLAERLIDCNANVDTMFSLANTFENDYGTCRPTIDAYKVCDPARQTCKTDLQRCRTDSAMYSEKYSSELQLNTLCSQNTLGMNQRISMCSGCNVTLNGVNNQCDVTLTDQNQKITNLNRQWNTCMISLSTDTTKLDELNKRNLAMYREIEELRKSCRQFEEKSVSTSIDAIKAQAAKTTDIITESIKNKVCPTFLPAPISRVPIPDTTKMYVTIESSGKVEDGTKPAAPVAAAAVAAAATAAK